MSADLRRKLLLSLGIGLLFYVGFVLFSDFSQLKTALVDFPWPWLSVVILLTLFNYLGRLARWQWMLLRLGVPIAARDTGRIFGVGMLMVMTPGKAGELLKSYMIKGVSGAPMSLTAPTILAERMIDGAAMLMLASVGLIAFPDERAQLVALLVVVVFIVGVVAIQYRPLALWLLGVGERTPGIKKFARHLHTFYESAYIIFGPRNLLIALLVGVLCWGAEGVAYGIVLVGFGAPATWDTLFKAIFIFNISTVIGAVFALPGGLGGVEGSMVLLSRRLLGFTTPVATAAALLTRFITLWMGVGIGVVSFLLWPKLLAGAENESSSSQPVSADHPPTFDDDLTNDAPAP